MMKKFIEVPVELMISVYTVAFRVEEGGEHEFMPSWLLLLLLLLLLLPALRLGMDILLIINHQLVFHSVHKNWLFLYLIDSFGQLAHIAICISDSLLQCCR